MILHRVDCCSGRPKAHRGGHFREHRAPIAQRCASAGQSTKTLRANANAPRDLFRYVVSVFASLVPRFSKIFSRDATDKVAINPLNYLSFPKHEMSLSIKIVRLGLTDFYATKQILPFISTKSLQHAKHLHHLVRVALGRQPIEVTTVRSSVAIATPPRVASLKRCASFRKPCPRAS